MPTVVIVDDSPTELENLRSIMEDHGYSVHTANGGKEGVELVRKVKPAVILMDIVMGEMNGFKATRKIKKIDGCALIPVIMVTTKDQPTDKDWALGQGASGYVTKPVNPLELIEEITKCLN